MHSLADNSQPIVCDCSHCKGLAQSCIVSTLGPELNESARGSRMAQRVCPWWLGYFLASPLRRLLEDPRTIVDPFVREGMTVLEPGPGMGFFTLELARRVGPKGRVIALDVQQKMLDSLKRRASKARLLDRIELRLVPPTSLGIEDLAGKVDFTLAYALVHEIPDPGEFFLQVSAASKPTAGVLLVEPAGHVNAVEFERELQLADSTGLRLIDRPRLKRRHAAVLQKR